MANERKLPNDLLAFTAEELHIFSSISTLTMRPRAKDCKVECNIESQADNQTKKAWLLAHRDREKIAASAVAEILKKNGIRDVKIDHRHTADQLKNDWFIKFDENSWHRADRIIDAIITEMQRITGNIRSGNAR